MINFFSADFNRLIVHKIYKKERFETHARVDTDDTLIDLDEGVRDVIVNQLSIACGKRSKSLRTKIQQTGKDSFFSYVKDLKSKTDEEFVEVSKKVAIKLGTCTTRSNPNEGVLIVIDGYENKGEGDYFIIVIKAEYQEALKEEIDIDSKKKKLLLLEDLFLSKSDRLYKIGMIKETEDGTESYPDSEYASLLFDDQFITSIKNKPAEYFYKDFLGFHIGENDKVLTKDFYEQVKSVINSSPCKTETKRTAHQTLVSLLESEGRLVINPAEFARKNFTDEILSSFESNILTQPRFERSFKKDTSLMGRFGKKMKIEFDGNITIQGPYANFEDYVKVIENQDEAMRAIDSDRFSLIRVKGKPNFDA